jgi:hypothetical protein
LTPGPGSGPRALCRSSSCSSIHASTLPPVIDPRDLSFGPSRAIGRASQPRSGLQRPPDRRMAPEVERKRRELAALVGKVFALCKEQEDAAVSELSGDRFDPRFARLPIRGVKDGVGQS